MQTEKWWLKSFVDYNELSVRRLQVVRSFLMIWKWLRLTAFISSPSVGERPQTISHYCWPLSLTQQDRDPFPWRTGG